MRINYNVSAMLSNNALSNNDRRLQSSMERLSSGLKINHAKDNPAGLAMAKRMNAQIVGLSTASQNASDGISVIEIADGALTEVSAMLQRMNELCVKSATGSLTEDDRKVIQEEVAQLKKEIDRVSETTEFNGQKLLNGEFERKKYLYHGTGTSANPIDVDKIRLSYCSQEVPAGMYGITKLTINPPAVEVGEGSFPADLKAEVNNGIFTIKGANGFEVQFDVADVKSNEYNTLSMEVTDIGLMDLQIGANEGQLLGVDIPAMSTRNMGISRLDATTPEGANAGIEQIRGAIQFVSKIRGRLGAYQNRLDSTGNSLDISGENMTAAYSRIMDVDMAAEMTEYSTNQVLTQAGTSMLAQANERPSQILQLLR